MQYRTLESLCKIASGGTPSRSKKEYWDGGDVPWIKIGNIKSKVVSNADEYITEAGLNNSSAKLFKKGTILYTIFATLGEVGILDFDACTNQAIAGVSIEKPEEITADYLYYYLKSKKAEVNKIGRGVAQNNINLSILRKFLIPMRAIEEQKTIVNSLNKIESIIEKQKQQLEQLNNLIKARFVEMFKDCIESVKLEQVVTSIKTGKLDANVEKKDGKYPFFTCDAIPKRIDDYAFDAEAILISGNGSRVGHVHYYKGKFNAYQRTYVLSDFRHDIDLSYLKTYLENELRPYIARNKKGSAVPYITLPMLQNFKLPFPPLEKQKEFATFVAQIDKSKFALSNELAMGNFYIRLIHDCIMHGCIDL